MKNIYIIKNKSLTLLLLILVFSTPLNILNLDAYPLSGDEIITFNITTGLGHTPSSYWDTKPIPLTKSVFTSNDYSQKFSEENVLKYAINDNGNSIIYDFVLHYWFKLIGVSVFKGRLFSVVFSILTNIALFLIILKITNNDKIAFLSGILLSCHPMFIHFAHQARCYSLALSLTTLSIYLFILILDEDNKLKLLTYYFLLSITFIGAFLSHYLTIYIYIFIAFYFILQGTRNLSIIDHLPGIIVTAIITSTVLYTWFFVFGGLEGKKIMDIQDKFILENTSINTKTSLRSIIDGFMQQMIAVWGNYLQYLGFRIREILFFLMLPIIIFALNYKIAFQLIEKRWIFFLSLLVLLPSLNALFTSIRAGHTTAFHARYAIFIIPFAMGLLAVFIFASFHQTNRKIIWINRTVFALLAITFIISWIPSFTGYFGTYNDRPELKENVLALKLGNFQPEPYEQVANTIKNIYREKDTIIYSTWSQAQYTNLYLLNNPKFIQKVDPSLPNYMIILFRKNKNDSLEINYSH